VAVTPNCTVAPIVTVRLKGCAVIVGALSGMTISVAVLLSCETVPEVVATVKLPASARAAALMAVNGAALQDRRLHCMDWLGRGWQAGAGTSEFPTITARVPRASELKCGSGRRLHARCARLVARVSKQERRSGKQQDKE
jgi:hypothetical protein